MAELFSSAYLWTDSSGNTPPSSFDSFSGTMTLSANDTITCAVPALAGDTISLNVAFDGSDPSAEVDVSDSSSTSIPFYYSDTPQDGVVQIESLLSPTSSPASISLIGTGSATLTLSFPTYPSRKPKELFSDPENWMDAQGNSPPSQYDAGTQKYTLNASDTLYCTQGSIPGDTITFDSTLTGDAGQENVEVTDHAVTNENWDTSHSFKVSTVGHAVARQVQIIGTVEFSEGTPNPITLAPPPAPPPPPTRKLELCYSKDGGHTFSPWRQADLGNQGDFNARALFRRLGLGRRIVLRIRYSGDSTRDVVQASVDTSPFP